MYVVIFLFGIFEGKSINVKGISNELQVYILQATFAEPDVIILFFLIIIVLWVPSEHQDIYSWPEITKHKAGQRVNYDKARTHTHINNVNITSLLAYYTGQQVSICLMTT